MTTIAFKDGIIAGDSAVSASGTSYGNVARPKFSVIRPGFVVAIAGDLAIAASIIDHCEKVRAISPKTAKSCILRIIKQSGLSRQDNFEAFFICKDDVTFKIYYVDCNLYPFEIAQEVHAIGSGFKFAMGAMAAGSSAKQAVSVAKQFDHDTGGKISVYDMNLDKWLK